ncbi:MAG: MFS transporter [Subdoligranulum sp.]
MLIATGGAVISYIPIGVLASKFGRKRTIMAGIILLAFCFGLGYFLTTTYSSINAIMFIVFALVGLAWAAINVNSCPWSLRCAEAPDIGKFTGYYYTFSTGGAGRDPVITGYLSAQLRLHSSVPLRCRIRLH